MNKTDRDNSKPELINLNIITPSIAFSLISLIALLGVNVIADSNENLSRNQLYYFWVAFMVMISWLLMRYLRVKIGGSFIVPVMVGLGFLFTIGNVGLLIFPLAVSVVYWFLARRKQKKSKEDENKEAT